MIAGRYMVKTSYGTSCANNHRKHFCYVNNAGIMGFNSRNCSPLILSTKDTGNHDSVIHKGRNGKPKRLANQCCANRHELDGSEEVHKL